MTATEQPVISGIDLEWVDPAVRPQDDLYAHVNGRWLREHVIPDDRSQDGSFRTLRDESEVHVRAIIEDVAAGSPEPGSDAQRIGDLYASFMDTDRIEALGITPLTPLLDEIAAATDKAGLAAALGRRQRQAGSACSGRS